MSGTWRGKGSIMEKRENAAERRVLDRMVDGVPERLTVMALRNGVNLRLGGAFLRDLFKWAGRARHAIALEVLAEDEQRKAREVSR